MYCKRVLVPIDFGPTSGAALTYGVDLSRIFGADLHLLHVSDSAGVREFVAVTAADSGPDAKAQLTALLTDTQHRDLHAVCETRVGAPADAILDYALQQDIDLIVMGTHGREGVAHSLLGSVAETVVRKANCPVLTVHQLEREFAAETQIAKALP